MGNAVSATDWLDDDSKEPRVYFQLSGDEHDWIHGGQFIGCKATLQFLKDKGIKKVVTLTVEPIKIGRNINHQSEVYTAAEWCDTDFFEADLKEAFDTIHHVPITDGCFPNREAAHNLLQIARESMQSKTPTYFHCWGGRGRTCTSIVYILMQLYNQSFEQACETIQAVNPKRFLLKEPQIRFLTAGDNVESLYTEYVPQFYNPEVRTPLDCRCYTTGKETK